MIRSLSLLSLAWCRAGISFAQPIDVVPIHVDILYTPVSVRAAGKHLLVYELHVSNVGNSGDMRLEKVEVWAGTKLAELSGQELEDSTRRTGPEEGPSTLLKAGIRSIVNLFVRADTDPDRLQNRLTVREAGSGNLSVIDCCAVPVARNGLRLSPPLRGEGWVAVNGPGNGAHHRRSIVPMNGRLRIPQRFAIDWIQPYPDGAWYQGNPLENRNYRSYGAEVLAVANARVHAVVDRIPENVPDNEKRAVSMTLETMGGNQVVLDLGANRYAFYGHLQPGSIRVKTGQRVRKGHVLALLGNSGNSTAPHLHFHVSDGRTILEGEGLPYVIDRFRRNGVDVRDELPLQDWAVDF